jgi:hypothetical protein
MDGEDVKKIGIVFGMENTSPWAPIERISGTEVQDVAADPVKVGRATTGVPAGHTWIVEHASKMLVDRALRPRPQPGEQAWQQGLRR